MLERCIQCRFFNDLDETGHNRCIVCFQDGDKIPTMFKEAPLSKVQAVAREKARQLDMFGWLG
jgi:hypothetical protein